MLDFRLTGPLELRWTRYYHSLQAHRTFSIGRGCAHEFEQPRRLSIGTDGVLYEQAARRSLRFPPLARDGALCMVHGFKLTRLSSTRYTIEGHGQAGMGSDSLVERATLPCIGSGAACRSQFPLRTQRPERLVAIDDSAGRRLAAESDDVGAAESGLRTVPMAFW